MLPLYFVVFFGLAAAQEGPRVISQQDFSGGLNTLSSPILLRDNESPALQNVIVDLGGVRRRKGYSKLNSSAIGGGSNDVNGIFELRQSDGDNYCIAFSSTNGFSSTDGCQTFTSFISTLTRNNDVNCVAYNDNAYCVNDQYNFRFDGTNDIQFTVSPADMDFLMVHRNRCFGAGVGATPYRLFWSALGNCNSWTVNTDFVDIDTLAGDIITGIGEPLFGMLFVYTRYSTWVLKGDSPTNWLLINVSKNTGARSHRSIRNFNNAQLFDSVGPHGGQPGIYATDGLVVREISRNVRGELDLASPFSSSLGRKIIDSKADFDNATFDVRAMSSSREPGFMQSSFTTLTDTLGSDFGTGTLVNVSTQVTIGALTMSSTTVRDSFDDLNFESGPATWTVAAGNWQAPSGKLSTNGGNTDLVNRIFSTNISISSGQWEFTHSYTSDTPAFCNTQSAGTHCFDFRFLKQGNGDFYSVRLQQAADGTPSIRLVKNVSSVLTTMTSRNIAQTTTNTSYKYRVDRSSDGRMFLWLDDVWQSSTTDTAISGPGYIEIAGTHLTVTNPDTVNEFDNIFAYQYRNVGSLTSRIFDTTISTPIWGLFAVGMSSDVDKRITFQVQSSTAGDGGGFQSLISQSLDVEVGAAQRRYIRYVATFANDSATETARINDVTVTAASTGVWTSDELFLSNQISAGPWGLFQRTQTTSGSEASVVYAVAIATYSGGTNTAPWVVVTNGVAINYSTGAYIVIRATYTVGVATETAKTDSIVINWSEGATTRSPSAAVFENRYHYGTQSAAATTADTIYVLDQNGAWVKWVGVQPRHLNVVNQKFTMGGSTTVSGGFVYQLYQSDADDGAAINASWDSKDYPFSGIQQLKSVDRVYLIHSPDATTLTTTLKADTGARMASRDINLSTGAAFGVTQWQVQPPLNGRSFRIKVGNDAASKPWQLLGFGMLYRDLGLIQP